MADAPEDAPVALIGRLAEQHCCDDEWIASVTHLSDRTGPLGVATQSLLGLRL